MDDQFSIRVDAIAADALSARAESAGHSVEEEVATVRREARRLSIEQKLALSASQRAMTPADCLSGDGTLIIRWFRDTSGGRDTDDGWVDADGR